MFSLLKSPSFPPYSTTRVVACAIQSQFMLKLNKCIENSSSCCSIVSTTTLPPATASKQHKQRERDNTTVLSHQGHTTKNYQSHSRLALTAPITATATTTADRPVYSLVSYFGKELVSGKHLTRHSRFYCTKQSTRKKMVNYF